MRGVPVCDAHTYRQINCTKDSEGMWIVKLVKTPVINVYKQDYFPRKFAYKKDAEKLAKEVQRNGGEAIVQKNRRK
jgi:hypothetical protein